MTSITRDMDLTSYLNESGDSDKFEGIIREILNNKYVLDTNQNKKANKHKGIDLTAAFINLEENIKQLNEKDLLATSR